jgi:hypothetical protein
MRGMIAVGDVNGCLPKGRQEATEAKGIKLLAKVEQRTLLGELWNLQTMIDACKDLYWNTP